MKTNATCEGKLMIKNSNFENDPIRIQNEDKVKGRKRTNKGGRWKVEMVCRVKIMRIAGVKPKEWLSNEDRKEREDDLKKFTEEMDYKWQRMKQWKIVKNQTADGN